MNARDEGQPARAPRPALSGQECLQIIEQAVAQKHAALMGPLSMCFVVLEEGAFTLQTAPQVQLTEALRKDVDLMVMCNAATLTDLLYGDFDHDNARPEQVWVWAGDAAAWARLHQALAGASSWLSSRISAVSATRATSRKRRRR